MEDPRIISALFIFLKMAYYNVLINSVTAGGKVLVNDPNDSSSKNYINREFDMITEVHATANAYWIFAKK